MSLDDIFELEEPRPRRLWAVIAIVLPVGLFAGFAAWFIRAYVVPPMVTITESVAFIAPAPPLAAPAPDAATTGTALADEPPTETAAATTPEPAPTPQPLDRYFATLALVPMSIAHPQAEPPVNVSELDRSTGPALQNSEPITGPVPLPHPRPRASVTANHGIPLPRPRVEN